MNSKNAAGFAVDKVLVPGIVLATLYLSLSRLFNHPLDLVNIIRGIVVPVIILTFLILSKPPRISQLNLPGALGIALSFGGFYLFEGAAHRPPVPIIIFGLSTTLFYLGISVWSYLILGKNLSVVPALREVVSNGPYQFVRHPIYACYLHLALSYLIILPGLINGIAALIVFAGLFLRAREEESLLATDPAYVLYRQRNSNKFFSVLFSFPLFILFTLALLFQISPIQKSAAPEPMILQFAHPATSLNPLVYDDWSSVFIGNHIYPRFIHEESRPEVPSVARDLILNCKDGTELNSQCPVLRLTFSIAPFSDCEGRDYSAQDIKAEFFQIIGKKSWILPHMRECEAEGSDICVDLPNAPDIKRRLSNLYTRFGWSKATAADKNIGAGPYCLSIISRKGDEIQAGKLQSKASVNLPRLIHFHTSIDVERHFNIALYGTSELLTGQRVNVMTHTPLGYYVVTNPKKKNHWIPWNTNSTKAIIKSHFQHFNLIYSADHQIGEVLPKGTASSTEAVEYGKSDLASTLALPDYIPQCQILSEQLNLHWRAKRLRSRAECINTSYFVEQMMTDKARKWGGFLTPLSPGAPGRNAIHYQYFSADSAEAWTGSEKQSDQYYYLVGIGQSFVTVDNSTICGLKPNSMGHGDIFITDFAPCDN